MSYLRSQKKRKRPWVKTYRKKKRNKSASVKKGANLLRQLTWRKDRGKGKKRTSHKREEEKPNRQSQFANLIRVERRNIRKNTRKTTQHKRKSDFARTKGEQNNTCRLDPDLKTSRQPCTGEMEPIQRDVSYVTNEKNRKLIAEASEELHMQIGELPVTYLGIPLSARRLKVAEYESLIHKINRKINNWGTYKLSYTGRLQLIKGVLYGILQFWSKVLLLLRTVIKTIISLLRKFLWTGGTTSNRSPVAWKVVCQPLDEGGLGIKKVLAWNKVALAELIFDIHSNQDSIWLTWVKANLLHQQDIWTANRRGTDSSLWTSILSLRDEILTIRHSNSVCYNAILSDKQVKGAVIYDWMRTNGTTQPWGSVIWGKINTPCISFMTWLIVNNGVYTRARLYRLGLILDSSCSLCPGEEENTHHLWFTCPYSQTVLHAILTWIKSGRICLTMEDWLQHLARYRGNRCFPFYLWIASYSAAMYYIWQARNLRLFRGEYRSSAATSNQAITHVRSCLRARWKPRNRATRKWLLKLGIDDNL